MKIIIPSNRDKVITTANMNDDLLQHVEVLGHHKPVNGHMGQLRQDYFDEIDDGYVIFADDDLFFQRRDDFDIWEEAKGQDLTDMFVQLWDWLEAGAGYVGVANRFMVNQREWKYHTSAPSMIYGFDVSLAREKGIRFDDIPLCEDWHFALSMYENGIAGTFTSEWCVQDRSGGRGGLENIRHADLVRQSMNMMHQLHPKYVSVRDKPGAKSQRHQVDLGMTVQWKKAYEDAR